MVDRFDGPREMQPYKHGDFVLYSDYAALKAENERLTKERGKFIREAGRHFAKSCELADRALAAETTEPQPILVTDEMVEAGFRAFSDKVLMREEDKSLVRSVIEAALAARQCATEEAAADDDDYCPKCGGGPDACRSTGCPGDERALALTRPSEQAVTEAMVDAVVKAIRPYTRDTLFLDEHQILVRNALKAAMEAGRHG